MDSQSQNDINATQVYIDTLEGEVAYKQGIIEILKRNLKIQMDGYTTDQTRIDAAIASLQTAPSADAQ